MPDASPPEPLTRDEVKLNLRVDYDREDDLIDALIVAARMHIENETRLVLTPRSVTETADTLGRWLELSSWPVRNVIEVRYPLAGVMAPLPQGSWAWRPSRRPVRVLPVATGWGVAIPANAAPAFPVEIDVAAGFATPDDVPRPIRQAMQLLIAHLFGNRAAAEVGARAAAVEIPLGVSALLAPYRMVRI